MAAAVESTSEEGGGEGESLASARARAADTLERIACGYVRPGREAQLPVPLTSGEDGDPVRVFFMRSHVVCLDNSCQEVKLMFVFCVCTFVFSSVFSVCELV